jgi:hypothetical protein
MSRKWKLRKGHDTLVIVRRADLFPDDLVFMGLRIQAADLDCWLADPLARQTVVEIYEAVNGRTLRNLNQANSDELRRGVRPRLEQAFQRRELIAVRVPPSFTTQSPAQEVAAREAAAVPVAGRAPVTRPKTWIEIKLVDDEGRPVPGVRYRIELPDGDFQEGTLDGAGHARVEDIEPGTCRVTFPDLDRESWEPVAADLAAAAPAPEQSGTATT